MPADARREPPSEARHGHGRPPDGPPDEGSWAFARGFRSLLGWPQQNAAPALPPLTSSGQQAPSEYGPLLDGGVHRPSVPDPAHTRANESTVHRTTFTPKYKLKSYQIEMNELRW